jgi:hypothetical protein
MIGKKDTNEDVHIKLIDKGDHTALGLIESPRKHQNSHRASP